MKKAPAVGQHDELVEGHEVVVLDVGERSELALEPIQPGGVDVREGLERDGPTVAAASGRVDLTHPAAADPTEDLVGPDLAAHRESGTR